MSIASQVLKGAARYAATLRYRADRLQAEKLEIEARLQKIQSVFDAADLALKRLQSFVPMLDGDLQRPSCWIDHEKRSVLSPMTGGAHRVDFWECRECGFEMSTTV